MTRANSIASYEVLPHWKCCICKYTFDNVGKGKHLVLTAHAALRRFKTLHRLERPKCPGEFKYGPGKKKPER